MTVRVAIIRGGADGQPGMVAQGDGSIGVFSVAATRDEQFVLIGDNSAFSGIPNRVAVVHVRDAGDDGDTGDAGLVLVTENQGLHQLVFVGDGVVEDDGKVWWGSGYEYITGAIGVEP